MPEGPEIHRAADRIAKAIRGDVAERVEFGLERLRAWDTELSGARVVDVEARGKAILTRFDSGPAIYSHNQLYGRWYVQSAGVYPRTQRSLRLEIRTAEKAALLYSASDIEVLRPEDEPLHPYLAKLGPDALDPRVTEDIVVARMGERGFARRSLGALLLDQGFVSGLGNYLRTEILWWAGLHPSWRPCDLGDDERAHLAHWVLDVTRQSYATGGITDCPVRAESARIEGIPRREYRHATFARAGRPCRECGTPITKLEVASRRLYVCSQCQPARPTPAHTPR